MMPVLIHIQIGVRIDLNTVISLCPNLPYPHLINHHRLCLELVALPLRLLLVFFLRRHDDSYALARRSGQPSRYG